MTTDTDPHPDATQLISIADLLPTLSGADPAMLANVCHYLRGLSDRVKALPVARTGPLRVAAEAVSAPVEADAWQYSGPATKWEWAPADDGMRKWAQKQSDYKVRALVALATNPPQAEPSIEQQLQNAREDFATMRALTESGAAEIAGLTAELAQANAMCESLAVSVQDLANAKAAVDEAHAIELADEKAVVDVLRSELQDRLQKQRAAEAELEEVRKDAARLDYVLEEVSMRALGDAGILDDTRPAIDAAIAAASEAPKP